MQPSPQDDKGSAAAALERERQQRLERLKYETAQEFGLPTVRRQTNAEPPSGGDDDR